MQLGSSYSQCSTHQLRKNSPNERFLSPLEEALCASLALTGASAVLLRRGCRTQAVRRLALHRRSQDAVNASLITPAARFQPFQYIGIQANRELLFGGGPCFRCLGEELLAERRNIRVVDICILHPINSRQVASDRFLFTCSASAKSRPCLTKLLRFFPSSHSHIIPYCTYFCSYNRFRVAMDGRRLYI